MVGESTGILGLSCPSAGFCVAVDESGDIATLSNPGAQSPEWQVVHVDGNLDTRAAGGFDDGTENREREGVSCPSPSLCVAVDDRGNLLASTAPAGGASAWHIFNVDGRTQLDAISCAPATTFCAAVDSEGRLLVSGQAGAGADAVVFPRPRHRDEVPRPLLPQRRLLHCHRLRMECLHLHRTCEPGFMAPDWKHPHSRLLCHRGERERAVQGRRECFGREHFRRLARREHHVLRLALLLCDPELSHGRNLDEHRPRRPGQRLDRRSAGVAHRTGRHRGRGRLRVIVALRRWSLVRGRGSSRRARSPILRPGE